VPTSVSSRLGLFTGSWLTNDYRVTKALTVGGCAVANVGAAINIHFIREYFVAGYKYIWIGAGSRLAAKASG
jgi:hypothetical protein